MCVVCCTVVTVVAVGGSDGNVVVLFKSPKDTSQNSMPLHLLKPISLFLEWTKEKSEGI